MYFTSEILLNYSIFDIVLAHGVKSYARHFVIVTFRDNHVFRNLFRHVIISKVDYLFCTPEAKLAYLRVQLSFAMRWPSANSSKLKNAIKVSAINRVRITRRLYFRISNELHNSERNQRTDSFNERIKIMNSQADYCDINREYEILVNIAESAHNSIVAYLHTNY